MDESSEEEEEEKGKAAPPKKGAAAPAAAAAKGKLAPKKAGMIVVYLVFLMTLSHLLRSGICMCMRVCVCMYVWLSYRRIEKETTAYDIDKSL